MIPLPLLAISLSSADVLELWLKVNGGEDVRATTLAVKQGPIHRI